MYSSINFNNPVVANEKSTESRERSSGPLFLSLSLSLSLLLIYVDLLEGKKFGARKKIQGYSWRDCERPH